jgi:hypothetical protein
VDCHELLLLTDRVQKAQRVAAEADQPHGRERHQAQSCGCRHCQALARAAGAEHEEGQRQPGRYLDPDTGDQRARGGAETRANAGGERQRGGEQQEDQRVVVRTSDGQHEQHRVQPHERDRPTRRAAEAAGGPRDQRHRPEARGDRDCLQGPQPAGEAQRDGRVAQEREQRAVGGVLEGPSDEREDRVGGRLGSDMRVGVKAMQGSHTSEAQVAKHVLGDQRWPEQQNHVRPHDRRQEPAHGQRSRREQHHHVADAHDQHQRLKAAPGDAHAQILQRARHPVRPAAAAPRNVRRGPRGGTGRHQEDGRDHAEQAERAKRAQGASRSLRVGCSVYARGWRSGDSGTGYGGRGRYPLIVTSRRSARVCRAR